MTLVRATNDYRLDVGLELDSWDKTFTGTLPYEHHLMHQCDKMHYEVIDVYTMGR